MEAKFIKSDNGDFINVNFISMISPANEGWTIYVNDPSLNGATASSLVTFTIEEISRP